MRISLRWRTPPETSAGLNGLVGRAATVMASVEAPAPVLSLGPDTPCPCCGARARIDRLDLTVGLAKLHCLRCGLRYETGPWERRTVST